MQTFFYLVDTYSIYLEFFFLAIICFYLYKYFKPMQILSKNLFQGNDELTGEIHQRSGQLTYTFSLHLIGSLIMILTATKIFFDIDQSQMNLKDSIIIYIAPMFMLGIAFLLNKSKFNDARFTEPINKVIYWALIGYSLIQFTDSFMFLNSTFEYRHFFSASYDCLFLCILFPIVMFRAYSFSWIYLEMTKGMEEEPKEIDGAFQSKMI